MRYFKETIWQIKLLKPSHYNKIHKQRKELFMTSSKIGGCLELGELVFGMSAKGCGVSFEDNEKCPKRNTGDIQLCDYTKSH